jgi:hypothetical protein
MYCPQYHGGKMNFNKWHKERPIIQLEKDKTRPIPHIICNNKFKDDQGFINKVGNFPRGKHGAVCTQFI